MTRDDWDIYYDRFPPITEDKKFYVDHRLQWGPGRVRVMLQYDQDRQLSDHDVVTRTGMKYKTVSARRTELWRLQFLRPVGMKKIKRQRGQVWGVTSQGRYAIKELKKDPRWHGWF